MKAIPVQPVIIAGGSGTRLWPLSRAQYPKQFLVLQGRQSLFQQAALRLHALRCDDIDVHAACVVGNEEHRFLVLDQLASLPIVAPTVLLEPAGRNTAPAMTLAALFACQDGQDPVLVVTPADQTVGDEPAFAAALQRAMRMAAGGVFVVLGVEPDRVGDRLRLHPRANRDGDTPKVARFVEKPDADTAQRYLDEGGYYWNSGMFVVRASVWLEALERFRPDIACGHTRCLGQAQHRCGIRAAGQTLCSRRSRASRSTMR